MIICKLDLIQFENGRILDPFLYHVGFDLPNL